MSDFNSLGGKLERLSRRPQPGGDVSIANSAVHSLTDAVRQKPAAPPGSNNHDEIYEDRTLNSALPEPGSPRKECL